MATKTKKKPVIASVKKTSASPLNAKTTINFADFAKTFPQMDQFDPLKAFKMETSMFKGNKQIEQMAQDAAAASQAQMDAVLKSCTIFAKGMEDIMKTCLEICQDAGEKSQAAAKTVMACKTLNEFTDAQTRLAQASFDEFMTNATKISEKSVKLCTDAMEPINDSMGKAMKKANQMAA
jgi:phasin family protein